MQFLIRLAINTDPVYSMAKASTPLRTEFNLYVPLVAVLLKLSTA